MAVNKIRRSAHYRRAYTRSDGVRVKATHVEGSLVKSPKRRRSKSKSRSKSRSRSPKKSKRRQVKRRSKNRSKSLKRGSRYYRKGYTRSDGVRVKGTYVRRPRRSKSPKKQSKRKSRRSKSRKQSKSKSRVRIGPLRKGTLRKHGYSTSRTVASRHNALSKAVRSEGALPIFRKLNAVATLNKNRSPATSKKFLADRNWVKRTYM